jgi:hypothetical protein
MPCNSDYMEADRREIDLSRVACLQDEINGKAFKREYWEGYHPRVYNKGLSKTDADNMVSELCAFLSGADVAKYSLEMQIWWRDHQKADRAREEREFQARAKAEIRARVLAKLTPYEKKALGIKE